MDEIPTLILASASPRRRELLSRLGTPFRSVAAEIDESPLPGEAPEEAVARLAEAKARAVAEIAGADPSADLILGADTVAAVGDRILGKPVDRQDARRILRLISGTRHRVLTGVTLLETASGRATTEVAGTRITMRDLSDDEIEAYVASGESDGKAGAYAIQETADAFVTEREGSFSNVVGLPLEVVERLLAPFFGPARTVRREESP